MNELNRGAITITYKKPLIEWNNAVFPELPMEENIIGESKTYLINASFDNAGDVIKKHYKEIFEIELEGICIDESESPQKRNLKLFNEWFSYEISDLVIDLSNKSMFGD